MTPDRPRVGSEATRAAPARTPLCRLPGHRSPAAATRVARLAAAVRAGRRGISQPHTRAARPTIVPYRVHPIFRGVLFHNLPRTAKPLFLTNASATNASSRKVESGNERTAGHTHTSRRKARMNAHSLSIEAGLASDLNPNAMPFVPQEKRTQPSPVHVAASNDCDAWDMSRDQWVGHQHVGHFLDVQDTMATHLYRAPLKLKGDTRHRVHPRAPNYFVR